MDPLSAEYDKLRQDGLNRRRVQEKWEARQAGLLEMLRTGGHEPLVEASDTGDGVAVRLSCSKCGEVWRGKLLHRRFGLSPDRPCTGTASQVRSADLKPSVRSDDLADRDFRMALRGYAKDEVDEFLDRIVQALRMWESGRTGDLTPIDVQQKTFMVALRGYAEDEVDQFLDEIVIALRDHEQRRRSRDTSTVEAPVESHFPRKTPIRLPTGADGGVAEFREPTPTPADEEPPTTPVEDTPPTDARLLIARPDGGGRPFTVMFDDQPLGKLKPGATAEFDIPTGLHWVTIKTRKQESNTMMIEPREGDQIHLECQSVGAGQTDDLGRAIEGILLERIGS